MKVSSVVVVIHLVIVAPALAQSADVISSLQQKKQDGELQITLSPEEQKFKDDYDRALQQFTLERMEAFASFKANYNKQLAAYRSRLLKHWGEVDVSDEHKVVHYSDDDVKTVVDFEKEEVVVSIIHDEDKPPKNEDVVKAIDDARNINPNDTNKVANDGSSSEHSRVDVIDAYSDDKQSSEDLVDEAVVNVEKPEITKEDIDNETKYIDQQKESDQQQIDIIADNTSLPDKHVNKTKKRIERENESLKKNLPKQNKTTQAEKDALVKKRITRYKIPLKPKDQHKKVATVSSHVKEFGDKWQLPYNLLLAIIDTESSFNPLAESHIPAYGLMQVVPHSAGIDVNEFLHNKREPLFKDYLFVKEQNVEAGTAYLHLLDARYLKRIEDPKSRLFCVIAAYNTGVGNVARAFTNKPRSKMNSGVVQQINSLSATQVFDLLVKRLPYEETRRYLKKVDDRMAQYQGAI